MISVPTGTAYVEDDSDRCIVLTWQGRYVAVPKRVIRRLANRSDSSNELDDRQLVAAGIVMEPMAAPPRPRLRTLVIDAIATNLAVQLRLRVHQWSYVRDRLSADSIDLRPSTPAERSIALDVLNAVRIASVAPFVDPVCVPMALTIRSMLRRRHVPCRLVLTGSPMLFEPHLFVEIHGLRVDPATSSSAAPRFTMVRDDQ